MSDEPFDEEPAEHHRYRRYLQELEDVSEADEVALVATVLRDPVLSMAEPRSTAILSAGLANC